MSDEKLESFSGTNVSLGSSDALKDGKTTKEPDLDGAPESISSQDLQSVAGLTIPTSPSSPIAASDSSKTHSKSAPSSPNDIAHSPVDGRDTTQSGEQANYIQEIRRILARFQLQKHTTSQEYVNEKLPAMWHQYRQSCEQQRRARDSLRRSLDNLNLILDDKSKTFTTTLPDGARLASQLKVTASTQSIKEVGDHIESAQSGSFWKGQQYKLDDVHRW